MNAEEQASVIEKAKELRTSLVNLAKAVKNVEELSESHDELEVMVENLDCTIEEMQEALDEEEGREPKD